MHNQTKLCPFCSEEIKATAIKCRYCFSDLGEKDQSSLPPGTPSGSHPSTPSGHTPLTGIHLVNHALGDRYEILEEIGRGGMATVYKAIQKSLERTVALKVVHQNLLHDTEFVARFHREAKLCASLNHPNIVTVHDEGEVSGVHFMAMEYLEGTDLHRLIRSRGRLTPQQTLQYLLPVAEALDYAHGKGYIHRDIKSANIFITGSGRVVLMDFGIAHAAAGTQLTRAGTVIGTPEYMSPEQAEGKKVDHRTDLYSLGVVLYECLAGRVPFSGENAMSTIFQLTRNEPDDKPLGQTPASIRHLVTALLRKKPENRPSSAQSVAKGMKLLQQGKQWLPPSVASAEAASGSKSTGEQTQEPQTVKLGDKPGRASSQGGATSQGSGSPTMEKKKVSPVVWVLLLIGVLLGGVLINHVVTENRQQQEEQLEQSAWQQAERRNTIDAYNQYLAEYPRGRYVELAKAAIKKKQKEAEEEAARKRDRQAWNAAQKADVIDAYDQYMREYPRGMYADQARSRKRDLEKPSGAFIDRRDNQTYKWVRIGSQVWMAENLNYNAGSGSWCYRNNASNCNTYGRLYNWDTALNACPPGWRLPSDEEWTQLADFVGSNAGTKLKARSGWQDGGNGTDDFGFSALPGGYSPTKEATDYFGPGGYWWSSTERSSTGAWFRIIRPSNSNVHRGFMGKSGGCSLRCVREP